MRFVDSTASTTTQLGNRLLVRLLLVSRFHNIDVCRSAPGFITNSSVQLARSPRPSRILDGIYFDTGYHAHDLPLSKQTMYATHYSMYHIYFKGNVNDDRHTRSLSRFMFLGKDKEDRKDELFKRERLFKSKSRYAFEGSRHFENLHYLCIARKKNVSHICMYE